MLPKFFFPQAAVGGDEKTTTPYWDDENYVAQEKLDGARYIVHYDLDGRVRIYSRQISKKTGEPVLKTEQLAHIAAEAIENLPRGTVLDGEVVALGLSSSNLVTKVTGSKPERALEVQEQHGFLRYRAFDILAYGGKVLTELPYMSPSCSEESRSQYIANIFAPDANYKGEYIRPLTVECSETYKRKLYADVISKGGEGIILKDVRATYHQGDRHKSWVKVKKQRTFDVVFMSIELANEESVKKGAATATKTRIAGKAGAIKYGMHVHKPAYGGEGLFFSVSVPESNELTPLGTVSGFDDAMRDDITENHEKYIGRVFEVTGQEQFASGAIRHPRFIRWRDDKRAEDCIFRTDEG